MKPRNILLISFESAPFNKIGGLGNYAFELCRALRNTHDVRILIPKNNCAVPFNTLFGNKEWECVFHFKRYNKDTTVKGKLEKYLYNEITFYVFDCNLFEDIEIPIEEKAIEFCSVTLQSILKSIDFAPDILHLNDWQTGFVPYLLKTQYKNTYRDMKTIFTMLAHVYNAHYEGMDLLDTGISFADAVTTISKGYLQDLKEQGLFQNYNIIGIRTGICNSHRFSGNDFVNINPLNFISDKQHDKKMLQQKLGLTVNETIPLLCVVSRLDRIKGMSFIKDVISRILKMGLQIVIVGNNRDDYDYAGFFKSVADNHKKQAYYCTYSTGSEFEAYAGSDIFLMPSISESCGTSQMRAMNYGVVPIVSRINSLKDSVLDFDDYMNNGAVPTKGVGFCMESHGAEYIMQCIEKAVDIYENNSTLWERLVLNCASADFSWNEEIVNDYIDVYDGVWKYSCSFHT